MPEFSFCRTGRRLAGQDHPGPRRSPSPIGECRTATRLGRHSTWTLCQQRKSEDGFTLLHQRGPYAGCDSSLFGTAMPCLPWMTLLSDLVTSWLVLLMTGRSSGVAHVLSSICDRLISFSTRTPHRLPIPRVVGRPPIHIHMHTPMSTDPSPELEQGRETREGALSRDSDPSSVLLRRTQAGGRLKP